MARLSAGASARSSSRAASRAEPIACVGLSGQMHGAVLLDARGAVLRPSIIWCDQRTEAECRWLDETVGRERLLELTSNPALTNFTLTKLLWVRAPRAGRLAPRAPRAAAEGLHPLSAERRARDRRRRRLGHADARRRAAALVAATCSTPWASTHGCCPRCSSRRTICARVSARGGRAHRPSGRHADRRRRGRSGGRRDRHGHHAARRGQRDDRHVGRRLRRDRSSRHRSDRGGCTRSVTRCPGAGT